MKSFLLNLLSSFLGVFIALIFVFGLLALIFGTILTGLTTREAPTVKDNSILKLSLNQPIPDRGHDSPELVFVGDDFDLRERMGLNHILTSIEQAKSDDRIKGIYLDLGMINPGMATLEEIRNKLRTFKQSGKFVVAYGEMITEQNYYLASVADAVGINAAGIFEFNGFSYQQIFFKKALEKLGVDVQVFYVGQFKSATEPFRREDMSEANREQVRAYLQSFEDHYLSTVGGSRKIAPERLDSLQDALAIFNPADAVKAGLVDSLMYADQLHKVMRQKAGLEADADKPALHTISVMKYYKALKDEGKLVDFGPDTMIAVVYAEGDIMSGKSRDGTVGSETMAKAIRELRKKDHVGAIVLRINSPGGSALASETIWREIDLTREKKPITVSMGNVAASGGYYLAAPADKIFAQSTTITGSIGIFGMWMNMGELLEDQLGITSDTVKTAPYADAGNIFRSLQEREQEVIQDYVDAGYRLFLSRVAGGRGMDTSQVHKIAQGRVWTGSQAIEAGLVDYIGGLEDAIEKAGELAGLREYYTEAYPERKDFFEKLSGMFQAGTEMSEVMNSREMRPFKELYRNAHNMTQSNEQLFYRMPYDIKID